MRKMDNKGFFLSETLIVATVVTAVVTLLYVTIIGLLNNYSKRSYYNNVSSLYAADNIRTLMYNKGISYFVDKLDENKYYLVTCDDFKDATYPGEEELCKYVFNYGEKDIVEKDENGNPKKDKEGNLIIRDNNIGSIIIDKVIFTKYDITALKGFSDSIITEGTTTDYINTIPIVEGTSDYRIIVVLKDREESKNRKYWYTTLKVIG